MIQEKTVRIKKGLDLPISGAPEQRIDMGKRVSRIAVAADDLHGVRLPSMRVSEGDEVKRGQVIFEPKKIGGVRWTAPGAGRVVAIHRGHQRILQSVVIELTEDERSGAVDEAADRTEHEAAFESYTGKDIAALTREDIAQLLAESGLWTALRTRPFSKTPAVGTAPDALFITAMDTNPLAPSVGKILEGREQDFETGLVALSKLSDGPVFVCKKPDEDIPLNPTTGAITANFEGPHPAGLPGTHIHFLRPVGREKTVWHVMAQDVVAIGKLVKTGRLDVQRVVALGGPQVKEPRLLKTRLGASLDELTEGELKEGENRIISGSVFSGHTAMGEALGYLRRYDQTVSVLREGREREFLGWIGPGANRFSLAKFFVTALQPGRKFDFTTTTYGSHRAIIPFGLYEKVLPLDLMPTHLLRALSIGDIEMAETLGCLELDEEDLSLLAFVDAGKNRFGPMLRENLETIEKEG